MDDIIDACGADDVDWNMKVECCGGAFSVSRTSSVVRLGRAIIEDARRNGAEAIVVACPLCHSNLDLRQKAMTSRGEQPLPILFITQVVGLALGLPAETLGLEPALRRHRSRSSRDLVARAPRVRVDEEKACRRRRPPRPPPAPPSAPRRQGQGGRGRRAGARRRPRRRR